jgi:type VII secretion protein EccE
MPRVARMGQNTDMPSALRLAPVLIALEIAVLAVWWRPALAPLGLLIAAAALWRRSGRTVFQWAAVRIGWRRRRAAGWDRGGPTGVLGRVEVLAERDDAGEQVALLDDGLGTVAVLAVEPTRLVWRAGDVGPDAADPAWAAVAGLLADPVRPAAVQLVRTRHGRVWLAVRVDPGRSSDAAKRRGGGAAGTRRAAVALASRAVAALGDAGLYARILNPAEAREVLAAAAQGPDPGPAASEAEEGWRGWQGVDGAARRYWAADRPAAEEWSSVTLAPVAGPGRGSRAGAGAADAVTCRVLHVGESVPGATALDGRHGPALLAAAPLAWDADLGPAARVAPPALAGLGPVAAADTGAGAGAGSTGLPLGFDADGREVHARLHRCAATSVALVGGPAVGALLIRRAQARTVVVTARPEAWTDLPPAVTVLSPATAFEHPGGPAEPGLVLWDRIVPAARPAWCAVVTLVEDPTPASAAALRTADLVLAHRLDEEQAETLAAALSLSARQAHWLARGPEDGLAVVEGPDLAFLALGA